MPKGPRIHRDVLGYLIRLVKEYPSTTTAVELHNLVREKFEDENIPPLLRRPMPVLRTVQDYVKMIRNQMGKTQEQPWSLAIMDEASIPWEAANFLLEASIELKELKDEDPSKLWPESSRLMGELEEEAREMLKELLHYWSPPRRGVMTLRQAKWLWRIHLALPTVEKLRNILWKADLYACREMVAEYLDREFDTSDLDSNLRNLLRNIKKRQEQEGGKEP